MTSEKWKKLSQDEQNSIILHWVDPTTEATPESVHISQEIGMLGIAPDFVNDLNSMNEAVTQMVVKDMKKYDKFRINLLRVSLRPLVATAAQRAEAFVLTMEPE